MSLCLQRLPRVSQSFQQVMATCGCQNQSMCGIHSSFAQQLNILKQSQMLSGRFVVVGNRVCCLNFHDPIFLKKNICTERTEKLAFFELYTHNASTSRSILRNAMITLFFCKTSRSILFSLIFFFCIHLYSLYFTSRQEISRTYPALPLDLHIHSKFAVVKNDHS